MKGSGEIFRFFVMGLLLAGAGVFGVAHGVQVDAQLSSPRTAVGQPVQLSILVDGARGAEVPDNFAVDGLRIAFRGQSTSVNMMNFQVSMIASYNFLVLPEREGTFTIPSLTLHVEGKPYQTPALTLEVVGGGTIAAPPIAPAVPVHPALPPGGGQNPQSTPFRPPTQATPAPAPPSSADVPLDKLAFAELILPDGEVYVGQFVPVEIRLYFDQRFRFELNQMPTFSGEGFTAERLSEPVEKSQLIDGVPYQVVTFYSAITAVKTGALQIPSLKLAVNVVVPSQRTGRSLFDDFFGGDPFAGMFNETRELNLSTKAMELTVKSLPSEGKPASFQGAIGQFEIGQSISPARGKVGEPLKLSLTVSGQGNFARILAPQVTGDEGWRVYPGSDQFTPTDSVGFGGKKVFTLTVMPLEETRESPSAEFSYFDPVEGKYVTLRTQRDPVAIEGGKAPTGGAARTVAAASPTPGADAQDSEPKEGDEKPAESRELQLLAEWKAGTFVPLVARREFLAAQAAAAVGFFCFLAYLLLGVYQASEGSRAAKSRKRMRHLWQTLESGGTENVEFYEAARKLLIEEAGIAGKGCAVGVEYEWLEEPGLSVELRAGLREILERADQLKYAGARVENLDAAREKARVVLKEWGDWATKVSMRKGGNQ